MLHFGFHEVANQSWKYFSNSSVCHQRHFLYGLMMIPDEPEVRNHIAERFPPGKLSGLDDKSIKFPVFFNDRIDLIGYRVEVRFRQWALGLYQAKRVL